MIEVKLYDCIPTRNIEMTSLYIKQHIYGNRYIDAGVLLYTLIYKNEIQNINFTIEYKAPCNGFYVFNIACKNHAEWYNYGYIDEEPILCEIWESQEEFDNNSPKRYSPSLYYPKYGISHSCCSDEQSEKDSNNIDKCYTYLMRDTSNGYYKIGISKNPSYRERTLQSEKPTIELIKHKQFTNRADARQLEKQLHCRYECQRIRGEWFELSTIDIENIRRILE